MALAEARHHTAPRGQRTARAEATYDALRSQMTSVAGDTEIYSLFEDELGGTRPDRLFEVRPQESGISGAPWCRLSTARRSRRRLTFLCRRGRTSWWRRAGTWTCRSPSRLSKCPRSHLHSGIPAGAGCVLRSRWRNSWWKCLEQNVDIPVPRSGGFQGSRPRQVSTASSSHSRGAVDEA